MRRFTKKELKRGFRLALGVSKGKSRLFGWSLKGLADDLLRDSEKSRLSLRPWSNGE